MKMSDVFKLPLKIVAVDHSLNSYKVNDGNKICVADRMPAIKAQAAAHAINQHDALVAMNAELVEALEGMQSLNIKMARDFNGRTEPWNQIDEEHLHDAQVLLTKAKELSQ